jgi:hypothetical protein
VSEANGVGTLTMFRVSTRGVFITMGNSDTFLAIILLIFSLFARFTFVIMFHFVSKQIVKPATNKSSVYKCDSICGAH